MTASKNYTVVDLQKIKSFEEMAVIEAHNNRQRITPNADPDRFWRNVNLLEGQGQELPIRERAMQRIRLQGKRGRLGVNKPEEDTDYYRKNAVLGIGIVLSYSHEMEGKCSKDQWAKKSFAWACKRYGRENLMQAVFHDDEKTGHLHLIAIPMKKKEKTTKDGKVVEELKLDARSVMGNALEFKKMHTDYAEEMAPFGLVRGEENSERKKLSQKEIYWNKLEEEKHRERKKLYSDKEKSSKRELGLKKLVLKLKEKLIVEYKANLEEIENLQEEIANEVD